MCDEQKPEYSGYFARDRLFSRSHFTKLNRQYRFKLHATRRQRHTCTCQPEPDPRILRSPRKAASSKSHSKSSPTRSLKSASRLRQMCDITHTSV